MTRKKVIRYGRTARWALCFLGILAVSFGCTESGGENAPRRGGPGMGGPGMRGPGGMATAVRVAEVVSGAIEADATYVAQTRPLADVRLSAEVAGVVEAVHVDLGDRVEKGQVLARVRGRTFRQAVLESEASVAHAGASVLRATADLELAEKERDRALQLHERGALTRAELDGVEGRHRSALANLQLARADEQQRRARLDRARIELANTRVLAPFSGSIAERSVDPGALVSPGTQLFRVVDDEQVVVRFAAPESDVSRLAVGCPVVVEVDASGGETFEGRVERISPIVDPQTRTTPVEVVIPRDSSLRPGMFARANVVLETKEDATLVPYQAVVRRTAEDDEDVREGVFVLREETAHFREVDIGLRNRTHVEVVRGLEIGDQVVVAGHSELRSGGRVRLIDGSAGGSAPHRDKTGRARTGSPRRKGR